MDARIERSLQSVIGKLPEVRELESSAERHIHLHWLITRAVTILNGKPPILVGGGAVEFYTGVKFATGDLDIIAPDRKLCDQALNSLGFERPSGMHHYFNRQIAAIVEIHGTRLKGNEEPIELNYRKVPLLLICPEDCMVERLRKFRKHGSTVDLFNAFLIIYHQRDRIDKVRVTAQVEAAKLWKYYRPVQDIARSLVIDDIGVDEAAAELIQYMKSGDKKCAF